MTTGRTVLDFITAEPFRPFRLNMASGRSFQIDHPEMIEVGKSSLTVYGRPESSEESTDRWHRVSLMLLESIEPLEAKSGSGRP